MLLEWKKPSHDSACSWNAEQFGRKGFVTIGNVEGSELCLVDRLPVIGSEVRYRLVSVQDVSDLAEAEVALVDSIRLPDALQDENFFALRLTGKLTIKKGGVYCFFLNSDDGSRLFLDGGLVVDNDGHHTQRMVSGRWSLPPASTNWKCSTSIRAGQVARPRLVRSGHSLSVIAHIVHQRTCFGTLVDELPFVSRKMAAAALRKSLAP